MGGGYSFIQKALVLKTERKIFSVQTGTVAPGIVFILFPEKETNVRKINAQWGYRFRPCGGKGKLYNLPRRPRGGVEVQLYSFFNLGTRWWVGVQRHAPAALPSRNRPRYPTVQEAGWSPGSVHLCVSQLRPLNGDLRSSGSAMGIEYMTVDIKLII